ncbi:hypothetical protein [Escherichia coli]|uniref:hypothetical protein n=1 Tax=Escherichia coli TaxID=562 RepID=UPI000A6D68B4|nr:hypothetical protein [Escherichia coli]
MIVYPALLFCRLKILCVFLLPVLQKKPSRHGSGSALSATGNRLGEPTTPIAATPTVYDHLPTAWLPVPCKWALQGAGAVPGDLKAPG